jgi:sugar transferase (PEP-CTERM system associated)
MATRSFSNHVKGPILLLALAESVALCASVYLAGYIRFVGELSAFQQNLGPVFPRAALFMAAIQTGLLAVGLYQSRQRARFAGMLARLIVAFAGGGLVLMALFYAFPDLLLWRGILALAALIALVLISVTRFVFSKSVDQDLFRRRVLFLGAGRRTACLQRLRRRADQRGFMIVGFVPAHGDEVTVAPATLIAPTGSLLELARERDIDEIVIAMDDRRRSFPVEQLLSCRLSGIEVIDLVEFLERETGKVDVKLLNPSYIIFAPGFSRSVWRQFNARALDIVGSLTLLLISWPFMLLAALAIYIEDGRPVLYRQVRVGFEGKPFYLLKFRSMGVDAEPGGAAQWAMQNDDRVTRVGKIIRKYRIDELPQLLNVLTGHMSIVGPRPERPEFVDELTVKIPYYRERHYVKPGLTGWAQLCYSYGSSENDAIEKLQYDLYYVKNHSLLFDFAILVQTAEVVLWQKGSR